MIGAMLDLSVINQAELWSTIGGVTTEQDISRMGITIENSIHQNLLPVYLKQIIHHLRMIQW